MSTPKEMLSLYSGNRWTWQSYEISEMSFLFHILLNQIQWNEEMLEIRDISTVTHTYDYIIANYYVFLKLFLIALGLLLI